MRRADVLLVHMPFASACMPSLALALMKACLSSAGFSSEILYANLEFAARMAPIDYQTIANAYPDSLAMAGEWIFASSMFRTDPSAYMDTILSPLNDRASSGAKATFLRLKATISRTADLVPSYIEELAEDVIERNPRVVAFSSTFQQHCASLFLAREIKRRCPEIFVVFGGANCEGPMGLQTIRSFPQVDYVVSGPGEEVFPALVSMLMSKSPERNLVGVYSRAKQAGVEIAAEVPISQSPEVEFQDFLDKFYGCDLLSKELEPTVLLETSRGCWWGQRQHCTFCGLNGSTMAFRQKSPEQAVREIQACDTRYPGVQITATDNIMPVSFPKEVFARLAPSNARRVFYEVKSNMSREELVLLRGGGVREVQPGIESLSTHVLKLMKKGVGGLRNIQFLRWCVETGIQPYWNILYGFPGEDVADYEFMIEHLPLLEHLPPPNIPSPIRLDRYSPNFNGSPSNGFTEVAPAPAYSHLYPNLGRDELQQIAYYFTYRDTLSDELREAAMRLTSAVLNWRERHETATLFCQRRTGEGTLVVDLRAISSSLYALYDGCTEWVLRECADVTSTDKLLESGERVGWKMSAVQDSLSRLIANRHVLVEGDLVLALCIFADDEFKASPSVARELAYAFG